MDEVVAALPDDDLGHGNDERFAEAHRSSSGDSSDCILCAAQRARGETSASRLCCRFSHACRGARLGWRCAGGGRWAGHARRLCALGAPVAVSSQGNICIYYANERQQKSVRSYYGVLDQLVMAMAIDRHLCDVIQRV